VPPIPSLAVGLNLLEQKLHRELTLCAVVEQVVHPETRVVRLRAVRRLENQLVVVVALPQIGVGEID
jgi:hypothetical protein